MSGDSTAPTWRVEEEGTSTSEHSTSPIPTQTTKQPTRIAPSTTEEAFDCPGCSRSLQKRALTCRAGGWEVTEESVSALGLAFRFAEFSKDMLATFPYDEERARKSAVSLLFTCDICFNAVAPLSPKEDTEAVFYSCSTERPFVDIDVVDVEGDALGLKDGSSDIENSLREAVFMSLEANEAWVKHPRGVVVCNPCVMKGRDAYSASYEQARIKTEKAHCTAQRCKGEAFPQSGFILGYSKSYTAVCAACFNVCGMSRARANRDVGFMYSKPRFSLNPLRCHCAAMRDCLFARHCSFEPRMEDLAFKAREKEKLMQLRRNMLVAPMSPVRGQGGGLQSYVQQRLGMIRRWEQNTWAKARAVEILQGDFELLRDACLVGREDVVQDKSSLKTMKDLLEAFDVHFATKVERWIWDTFMIWMTHARPQCPKCENRCHHHKETFRSICFKCRKCGAERNIPRHHDAFELLRANVTDRHERFGRCGEFAQINYIMLSCAGFDVRWVDDQNDHVWVEVYSPKHAIWVERGANVKNRNYVFAFSRLGVDDVTPRYARHQSLAWLVQARQWLPETVLEMFLHNANQEFGTIERTVNVVEPVSTDTLRSADKHDPVFQDWLAYRSE